MPSFWHRADSWSPLAGGLLGGVLKRWQAGAVQAAFARLIEQYRPQLEAYEGLCEDLGETPPMWPGVAPAESCRYRSTDWASYGRTTPGAAATTVTLSDDTMAVSTKSGPAPGRSARAYAR